MNGAQEQHHRDDFEIIVNGRKKEVKEAEESFAQIVALAFNPVPTGPNVMFTITYRKGPRENPEGALTEGATVDIKDGMIFDVTETVKSKWGSKALARRGL